MTDPHVDFVVYMLKTNETPDFANPPPLQHETDAFMLRLESGRLIVTMKEHHASVESARRRVDPFLKAWELDLALRRRRQEISFEYETASVVNRNPPPPGCPRSIDLVAGAGTLSLTGFPARLTVTSRAYPPPPAGFVLSPDVETLWRRYEGYLDAKEPISSMANFCLTLVEHRGRDRRGAANLLGIEFAVLNKLGKLAATKGDEKTARKVPRMGFTPYSAQEVEWMEAAVRSIIRRLGELAAGCDLQPTLTMADLPPLQA